MVVPQETSKAFPAFDRDCRALGGRWSKQLSSESLVLSLGVIVGGELRDGVPEMPLAEADELVETLRFSGEDEPFGVSVEVFTPHESPPEMLPEEPVLRLWVDDLVLLPVEPTGEHRDDEMPWGDFLPPNLPRSQSLGRKAHILQVPGSRGIYRPIVYWTRRE